MKLCQTSQSISNLGFPTLGSLVVQEIHEGSLYEGFRVNNLGIANLGL